MDNWIPKVKNGGIVVMHDFSIKHNYNKRDLCFDAGKKRRWGVGPAFYMSKAGRSLQMIIKPVKNTPGMAVFRKVK